MIFRTLKMLSFSLFTIFTLHDLRTSLMYIFQPFLFAREKKKFRAVAHDPNPSLTLSIFFIQMSSIKMLFVYVILLK